VGCEGNARLPGSPCLIDCLLGRCRSSPGGIGDTPAGEVASKPAIRFTYVDVHIDSKDEPWPRTSSSWPPRRRREDRRYRGRRARGLQGPAVLRLGRDEPGSCHHRGVQHRQGPAKGKTRVARVHVQVTGEQKPEYVLKLEVAASSEAQPISGATATVTEGGSR